MQSSLLQKLESIGVGVSSAIPELLITAGILAIVVFSLIFRKQIVVFHLFAFLIFTTSLAFNLVAFSSHQTIALFQNMVQRDDFAIYLKMLFDLAGILTVVMTWRNRMQENLAEYYALLLTIVLGAHLLVMSINLIMLFISLELISISSYVLTGFAFNKKSTEGSLKYFVFGSVASATMLYGFSILYGLTGTLHFTSDTFIQTVITRSSPLLLVGGLMSLAGILFKIAAAPFHPWAPDVYEASPMPVVAFFSVVPKLAGIGILSRFILGLHAFGQSSFDWQLILSIVAILTLTFGNFSALAQKNVKRLMAYSSIAQSGFLLVGIIAFLPEGLEATLWYATVYLLLNYLTFIYLQQFENAGVTTIAGFSGLGKIYLFPSVALLIAFIGLTGLPPTAGFTGKLFIFSTLWQSYELSGKTVLLWLLIFGLLNTVVSLFYYLRIPYYAFIRSEGSTVARNNLTYENLLAFILVLMILLLFFSPGLLMGWINKINFAA